MIPRYLIYSLLFMVLVFFGLALLLWVSKDAVVTLCITLLIVILVLATERNGGSRC